VALVAIILALAAALSVATFSRSDLATKVREAASAGVSGIKTVAAMLADRSPGERPAGALASLKQKRQPALHQRALPKVRKPESPLMGIVGAPPVPPVEVLPTTPLYAMVTSPPVPEALIPGGPVGGGVIPPSGNSSPPGGGGGIIVPPQTPETPIVPGTPGTPSVPAVPEPATWTMMLVGFGLIGWAIRRDRRTVAPTVAS
jgi:hypothetical protein